MHIVVCAKQIPDPETPPSAFRIDAATNKVVPAQGIAPVLSQFDGIAAEAALRIKEANAGSKVTVISLGADTAAAAIKQVLAAADDTPTLVFDEVDAGIGGRVADIVGRKLRHLANARQVLCVTHLPQVASQGQAHYRVMKLSDGKTSRTQVKPLSKDERVEELSRMLGGVEITDRTRAHAAEMIDRAAR